MWSTSRGCAARRGASGSRSRSTRRSGGRRSSTSARSRSATRADSAVAALLLVGWLASRLGWTPEVLARNGNGALARPRARRTAAMSQVTLEPVARARRAGPGRSDARDGVRGLRSRSTARPAGSPRRARRPTGAAPRGRCSAPRAARAASSARECARPCCATRPTARRSPPPASMLAVMERLVLGRPRGAAAERIAAVAAGGRPHRADGRLDSARGLRAGRLRWTSTGRACTLWFGDERCVPPDDERSNYGMVRDRAAGPAHGARCRPCGAWRGELGPHAGGRRRTSGRSRDEAGAVRPRAAGARSGRTLRFAVPRRSGARRAAPPRRGRGAGRAWSRSCRA